MTNVSVLESPRKRVLFLCLLAAVVFLTLAAGLCYAVPLRGLPQAQINLMDTGWSCQQQDGTLTALPRLPCHLEWEEETLVLVRDLSDWQQYPGDVLAISTRYQSIRVWADETLIYQAAQGEEQALSSMWHFIPADQYKEAAFLRVELTRYDGESDWELASPYQDHPGTIVLQLLQGHLPTILLWMACMFFTLLLMLAAIFMLVRRVAGCKLVFSLAGFIFLSGMWVLLDSKVTTIFGGNYALTYFSSYCVFYLLPVPLMFYFQFMLGEKVQPLQHLIWITLGNAGFWMLMHLLGILPIRYTAITVHLIILTFLAVLLRELLKDRESPLRKRLICTFWSSLLVFGTALVSIVMYHAELLPPSNSAVIFAWALLALIFSMILDTVRVLDQVWKNTQYIQVYRQLATEDTMTRLANRNAYELKIRDLIASPPAELTLILFDVDRMKQINDTYGHHAGDLALALTAKCILEVFGNMGDCYRIGGDEFCVMLTQNIQVDQELERFDQLISEGNTNAFPLTVSHGWETGSYQNRKSIPMKEFVELKKAADKDLYRMKQNRRQEY